jgi:hypothetical protein
MPVVNGLLVGKNELALPFGSSEEVSPTEIQQEQH